MKRTMLVLCLLIGWLAPLHLTAQSFPPGDQNAVPKAHPQDPRLFSVRNSGQEQVWFPTGFYGAALNMSTSEFSGDSQQSAPEKAFRNFINRLAEAKLNFARVWINYGMKQVPNTPGHEWDAQVVHPYPLVSTRGNPQKFDIEHWNDEYFTMLRNEVDYAASRKVVLQMVLFDCWHVRGLADRDYYRKDNNTSGVDWSNENDWYLPAPVGKIVPYQQKFVAKVIAEVGHYPNIIWETCNEDQRKTIGGDLANPQTWSSDWDTLVAGWIRTEERKPQPTPQSGSPLPPRVEHMIMPIQLPEHRSVAGYATPITNPKNEDQPHEQSIEDMRDDIVSEQRGWNFPLITDNDCCQPPLDDYGSIPREKAWAALTAGAHSDFFIDVLGESEHLLANARAVMSEVGTIQAFLGPQSSVNLVPVNLVGMTPNDALATVNVTSALRGVPAEKVWVYARPNDEFVIYLRALGVARLLTVSQLPASYTARWFKPYPVTPPTSPWTTAPNGPTFTPPNDDDWVLHIKRSATVEPFRLVVQPSPQTVAAGSSVSFSVIAAGGRTPYTYLWQKLVSGTWTPVGGASGTAATLTLNAVTSSQAGQYRVRVSDSSSPPATINSNAVQLDVTVPSTLNICTQPQGQWVALGGSATFTATACQGVAPYTFQWQYAATLAGSYANYGNASSGTAPASLSISPVTAARAGFYRLLVTDADGAQVTSNAVPLSLHCATDTYTLCVQNNRFKIQSWYFDAGAYHPAKVSFPLYGNWAGFFWFFDAPNVELEVKVLQGSAAWWVFFGAGTDVDYMVTVTDTKNVDPAGDHVKKDYHHEQGNLCHPADLNAFLKDYTTTSSFDPGSELASLAGFGGRIEPLAGSCVPTPTELCQAGNRFRVRVLKDGVAQRAEPLTNNTGTFWFYNRDNAEVLVKVLDGIHINNAYWVYYGSATNQAFQVEVTDTANPALPPKTYTHPLGDYCGGGDAWAYPQP